MLSFFPRGVLDEILNLIESVFEGFPSYFCSAKASLISSTKNISVFGYKVVEHLRVDLLTSSLSERCLEQLGPVCYKNNLMLRSILAELYSFARY